MADRAQFRQATGAALPQRRLLSSLLISILSVHTDKEFILVDFRSSSLSFYFQRNIVNIYSQPGNNYEQSVFSVSKE
jgi:hypothetical protein